MRYIRKIGLLIICILGLCVNSISTFGESRNIYIGDVITVDVETSELSKEEVIEGFKDFEIVDIVNSDNGYRISVKTFDIGEKTVTLDNGEIVIQIVSTLEDINRGDIYEDDLNVIGDKTVYPYDLVYYSLITILMISIIIFTRRHLLHNKNKNISPYEEFKFELNKLKIDGSNPLVDMTVLFKKYIEEVYNRNIKGKTSSEIMVDISEIKDLEEQRYELNEWLKICDGYKYDRSIIDSHGIEEMRSRLFKIVTTIDEKKEGAV